MTLRTRLYIFGYEMRSNLVCLLLSAILRIVGPNAFTLDTIPEETCCGQKLKQQKDTWIQPKVMLKGQEGEEDLNEPPYYPTSQTSPTMPSSVVDLYRPQMNGSRVNTAESTITHVSNDTLEVVVTTIAAQITPPFKVSDTAGLLQRATISVNDEVDIFKPRHLNEEDLIDGRVTLPIVKGQMMRHTPPPQLQSQAAIESPPTTPPTPPPEHQPSAPVFEAIDTPVSKRSIVSVDTTPRSRKSLPDHVNKTIYETALIHSDSPTIRADPVCSKRPVVELQPKIRRSGSSGTVIELLPMHLEAMPAEPAVGKSQQPSTLNQPPVPISSGAATAETASVSNNVTPNRKTPIKPIIKNKINHHNYQQNIYYVDDPSDKPPPPPPHSYEVQAQIQQQQQQKLAAAAAAALGSDTVPVYDVVTSYYPVVMANQGVAYATSSDIPPPLPLPRKFDAAPPYRDPPPPPPIAATSSSTATPAVVMAVVSSDVPPAPPPHAPDSLAEQVSTCRRRRRSRQKSLPMAGELDINQAALLAQQQLQQQQQQQKQQTDYNSQSTYTEEEVCSHVTSKARWNRSKSCHSRSNSLKKSKRKLAPDEDLITVVTDEPHHHFAADHMGVPQPKPRTILTQVHRNGSASLGNIVIIDPDQYTLNSAFTVTASTDDPYASEKPYRQTLPRRHQHQHLQEQQQQQDQLQASPSEQLFHVDTPLQTAPPKPSPRGHLAEHSYHRHPLSHSTETILYTDDRYDPNPIIPNSTPDVPDIWLPMRSVKA